MDETCFFGFDEAEFMLRVEQKLNSGKPRVVYTSSTIVWHEAKGLIDSYRATELRAYLELRNQMMLNLRNVPRRY